VLEQWHDSRPLANSILVFIALPLYQTATKKFPYLPFACMPSNLSYTSLEIREWIHEIQDGFQPEFTIISLFLDSFAPHAQIMAENSASQKSHAPRISGFPFANEGSPFSEYFVVMSDCHHNNNLWRNPFVSPRKLLLIGEYPVLFQHAVHVYHKIQHPIHYLRAAEKQNYEAAAFFSSKEFLLKLKTQARALKEHYCIGRLVNSFAV